MNTPQERYRAIAEAAETLSELTSPNDLSKALAAEATALAANKVWNPKEELATESTNHENI